MPGEGSIESFLQEFLGEVKKVKGKKEEDVKNLMRENAILLGKLGKPYADIIRDKYSDFRTIVAYGESKNETKYVNMFVADIEDAVNAMLKVANENKQPPLPQPGVAQQGSTRPYRKKFDSCVKSVRRRIKPRKSSNKESAAIAICTKSVLQTRGRTMKKYKKGRLQTQKL